MRNINYLGIIVTTSILIACANSIDGKVVNPTTTGVESAPTELEASGVITYTVQIGDNLFNIADQFGLKPETILWGNPVTLRDTPQLLQPGIVINILPVDGVYYQWQSGDTIEAVAKQFEVDPRVIVDWPGNHLNTSWKVGDPPLEIEPGSMLVIPGGSIRLSTVATPPG